MDKKTEYEEELELLERSKENIRKSKLNAGILFVPESGQEPTHISFDADPTGERVRKIDDRIAYINRRLIVLENSSDQS